MDVVTEIKSLLEHIKEEVTELKKMPITLNLRNKARSERAWKRLMRSSKEIIRKWRGKSAIEEIRARREGVVIIHEHEKKWNNNFGINLILHSD